MIRMTLIAFASLALVACETFPPPAPIDVADRTLLDERLAIGLETGYALSAELGATAFRAGFIPRTRSPEALRDDFCQRVVAGLVNPQTLDRGGRIMAFDCRAYAAVVATRSAYAVGNATSYRQAYDNGIVLLGQLRRLISGDTT